ncbi:hypothetical protein V1227_18715 [Lentzea sp. DG1S-22]|uniref:hypothetical protein n=1 Tax=Lentzea sp. DG1S-22 TaxID=3108822 RepID=UPI002E7826E5|nr:hypothetical protein [Lentzea sp. DG1S-22]WVH84688.1 hypothetical protein V1227_18715 [Lentzea sp. DG1S-22]
MNTGPTTRKAPELAHEGDLLIVGFPEERRHYPQFRHQQVMAASTPLLFRLQGRKFRRAFFTSNAQSLRGFDRVEDLLHELVARGLGEMVVHADAYERLKAEDEAGEVETGERYASLLQALRQDRAFEA